MARLYADEQFPLPVVELLRTLGQDVLTVQEAGNAKSGIPASHTDLLVKSGFKNCDALESQGFVRSRLRSDRNYCKRSRTNCCRSLPKLKI